MPAIRIALPAALPDIPSNPRLIPQGSHENAVGFTPAGRLIIGGRTEPPSLSAGQHAFALEDGTLVVSGAGSPLPLPLRADGRRQAYPTTFHPVARQLTDAALVQLGPGEQRRGIDVTLRPVPVSRITGTLEGPAGAISNRRLSLLADPERSMPPDYEVAAALSDASGQSPQPIGNTSNPTACATPMRCPVAREIPSRNSAGSKCSQPSPSM